MSQNVILLCHELTLVIRDLDIGRVRYQVRSWRWVVTRDALANLQEGYKVQGKELVGSPQPPVQPVV